jgi:ATP-binding cassette subfamily F protein 3
MISIDSLTLEFGGFTLLNEISFLVKNTDRIGLVGKNGAGKSTLLKLMMGIQNPTKGRVTMQKDIKVGYLPQELDCDNSKTVYEETKTAIKEVNQLKDDIEKINLELAEREDYTSDSYAKLIDKLDFLNAKLINFGASNIDADIEKMLMGLGFKREDFDRSTSELSGGWRMRIELAKILLTKPDVMLLDEPTNHLDIESIQWFENFLKTNKIAIVLISHDRRFLDSITNRTIEISLGRTYDYTCPYSDYLEQRKLRMEQQIASYNNQQKLIKETEDFIERFRYKATKANQVQSRVKMLEKLERIEIDETEDIRIKIRFSDFQASGILVFEADQMSKAYGEHEVLKDIDLRIERGEKLAFVGKNGEGKSTLVKIITDQLDYEGNTKLGHNINIGYFAQDQAMKLDPNKTVFETIDDIATGDFRTKVRDMLGAFLFSGEDVDKKVSVLSGGEKTRLALIELLLKPYNVLILDEPTNHLDLTSKELLKSALKNYTGTVIIVSHDRHFLDGLCDKVLIFKDKKVKEHLGTIDEFLNSLFQEQVTSLKVSQQAKAKTVSDNKNLYEERKKIDKEIRKYKKQFENAEAQIEKLESQIEELEQEMISNFDQEIYQKHADAKKALEQAMTDWETSSEKMEELIEQKESLK